MSQGKIIESGDADSVYSNPQHSFTKRLLAAIPKGLPHGALGLVPT